MNMEAIKDWNSLMSLDPTYTGAYYIRGLAYEKLGEIEKSIEDYSTVLDIDPTHVNAAFARGACENKRGNYMKAIEDYNFALQLDSEKELRKEKTSYLSIKQSSFKRDNQWDLVSVGGTNSFIDGSEQPSSILSSTINSIQSTPNNK